MRFVYLVIMVLFLTGCAQVKELSKTFWGSSTRALENARKDALSRDYPCSVDECFDAVLSLQKEGTSALTNRLGIFDVFIKDRNQRHIVVIGIEGNVNTTEVGIFFNQIDPKKVKVEISSLSTSAKEKLATAIFKELDLRFKPNKDTP